MMYIRQYSNPLQVRNICTMLPDHERPVSVQVPLTMACPFHPELLDLYHRNVKNYDFPKVVRYKDRKRMQRISRVKGGFSASFATVLSVICAREALELDGENLLRMKRMGVSLGTARCALDSAHQFETRGLIEGWNLLDPLRFPHVLPSALAATVAMCTGSIAFAYTCSDGALAAIKAMDIGATSILKNRADHVLIGGADEVSDFLITALVYLNKCRYETGFMSEFRKPVIEGATVGILSRTSDDCVNSDIELDGFIEMNGGVNDNDVKIFQKAFLDSNETTFSLGIVNVSNSNLQGELVPNFLQKLLGFVPKLIWLGDDYGDLQGMSGALSLSILARCPKSTKAMICCFSTNKRVGILIARSTRKLPNRTEQISFI